ncbi:MAG: hypothetical protein ACM3XP_00395 [Nitrososphaerales archaeon]
MSCALSFIISLGIFKIKTFNRNRIKPIKLSGYNVSGLKANVEFVLPQKVLLDCTYEGRLYFIEFLRAENLININNVATDG